MTPYRPNEDRLKRVREQAVIDESIRDSQRLTKAVASLASVANDLKTIAADVGWTGVSAENAAETFTALGSRLYTHAENVANLQTVAKAAEGIDRRRPLVTAHPARHREGYPCRKTAHQPTQGQDRRP